MSGYRPNIERVLYGTQAMEDDFDWSPSHSRLLISLSYFAVHAFYLSRRLDRSCCHVHWVSSACSPAQIYSEAVGGVINIISSTFSSFSAFRAGGAIYALGEGGTSLTIYNVTFSGNGAASEQPGAGGAVFSGTGAALEVSASHFYDNFGARGAALYCCGGNIDGTSFVGGNTASEVTHLLYRGQKAELFFVLIMIFVRKRATGMLC